MFNTILIPIDVGDRSTSALATALELARQSRARVALIHVVQRVAGVQPDELRSFYRRLLRLSERKLKRAAGQFVRNGIAVRTEACIGEPVAEIVRAAARNKVDLIVMGSHTVDPARPTRGWGTISYRVGLLCGCPVLLVKRSEPLVRATSVMPRRGRGARRPSSGAGGPAAMRTQDPRRARSAP